MRLLSRLLLTLLLPAVAVYAADDKLHKSAAPAKGRYIVVLEDSVRLPEVAATAAELAHTHNATVQRVWTEAIHAFVADMPEARAIAMTHDPRVRFIEEDTIAAVSTAVNTNIDPSSVCDPPSTPCTTVNENRLWNLDRVEQDSPVLNNRFAYCTTGAGVYIYVMDTGVNAQHSEFWTSEIDHTVTRVLAGYSAAETMPAPGDPVDHAPANAPCAWDMDILSRYLCGHGTSVASIAAGRKVGIARGATIVPVKIIPYIPNRGPYQPTETTAMMTEGVNWILRVRPAGAQNPSDGNPDAYYDPNGNVRLHHPAVVTFSTYFLASKPDPPGTTSAFELALDALYNANITVIASANNQNDDACRTTPGRHSRNNPNISVRGKVITTGGTMIANSSMGPPVGVTGTYIATSPTRDARWVCDSTDDNPCSTGPVPPESNPGDYYAYHAGSNYGQCVSLFVPSRRITSAATGNDRDYRTGLGNTLDANGNLRETTWSSGTSFAAPFVAGAVARFLESNAGFTPDTIYDQLTLPGLNNSQGMLDTTTLGAGSPNIMLRFGDVEFSVAPVSIGVDANGQAVLSASATTSYPPVTYDWYRVVTPSYVPPSAAQRGWSSNVSAGSGSSITVAPSQITSYWVRATNTCCETDSNVATVYPRPATPQFLSATPSTSGTQVSLAWNSAAGAESYHIEREVSAPSGFGEVATTTSTSLSYATTASTAYVFRVRASAGDSTIRPAYSSYSNNDLAVTTPFTDLVIVAGQTFIRARHVTELRSAVNSMCDLLAIPHVYSNAALLESSLVGQAVRAADWNDLRNNINTLRTNAAINIGTFSFRDALTGGVPVKAIHLEDLRTSVK